MTLDDRADAREKKASPRSEMTEEPPAVPRPVDVVVRGGASRCPHCHDQVSADGDAWAACRSCLARHHVACWGEGGACASCGDHRFVSSVTTRAPVVRRVPSRKLGWLVVIFATATFALGIGLVDATFKNDDLRDAIVKEREESVRLRARLDAESRRAKELASARATRDPDILEHVVTFRRRGEGTFVSIKVTGTSDLDFAKSVASHVLQGDELARPAIYEAFLREVAGILENDPGRRDDRALIVKALAILAKK